MDYESQLSLFVCVILGADVAEPVEGQGKAAGPDGERVHTSQVVLGQGREAGGVVLV